MENHLVGLPEYGVLLTGTPENPVIENHSGRVVIGYMLTAADQNGIESAHQILLVTHMPPGLPDGGLLLVHGNVLLNPAVPVQGPMQSPAQMVSSSQGPIVRATLRSVIFANGQFVGVDEHRAFESFGKRIKAIVEIGLLGKAGAWDQVEAALNLHPVEVVVDGIRKRLMLPGHVPRGEDFSVYPFRQMSASRLVETRKFEGDAAANKIAEIYSSLPTLWK